MAHGSWILNDHQGAGISKECHERFDRARRLCDTAGHKHGEVRLPSGASGDGRNEGGMGR